MSEAPLYLQNAVFESSGAEGEAVGLEGACPGERHAVVRALFHSVSPTRTVSLNAHPPRTPLGPQA